MNLINSIPNDSYTTKIPYRDLSPSFKNSNILPDQTLTTTQITTHAIDLVVRNLIAKSHRLFSQTKVFFVNLVTDIFLKIKYIALVTFYGNIQAERQMNIDLCRAVKLKDIDQVERLLGFFKNYRYKIFKLFHYTNEFSQEKDQLKKPIFDHETTSIYLRIAKSRCLTKALVRDLFETIYGDFFPDSISEAHLRGVLLGDLIIQSPSLLNIQMQQTEFMNGYNPIELALQDLKESQDEDYLIKLEILKHLLLAAIHTKQPLVFWNTDHPINLILDIFIAKYDQYLEVVGPPISPAKNQYKDLLDRISHVIFLLSEVKFQGQFSIDTQTYLQSYMNLSGSFLEFNSGNINAIVQVYKALRSIFLFVPIFSDWENEDGSLNHENILFRTICAMIDLSSHFPGGEEWFDNIADLIPLLYYQLTLSPESLAFLGAIHKLPSSYKHKLLFFYYFSDVSHPDAIQLNEMPLIYQLAYHADDNLNEKLIKMFSNLSLDQQIPIIYSDLIWGEGQLKNEFQKMPFFQRLWAYTQLYGYLDKKFQDELYSGLSNELEERLLAPLSLYESETKALKESVIEYDKERYNNYKKAYYTLQIFRGQLSSFNRLMHKDNVFDVVQSRYGQSETLSKEAFDEATASFLINAEIEFQGRLLSELKDSSDSSILSLQNLLANVQKIIQGIDQLDHKEFSKLISKLNPVGSSNPPFGDQDIFGLLSEFGVSTMDDYINILNVEASKLWSLGLYRGEDLEALGLDHTFKDLLDRHYDLLESDLDQEIDWNAMFETLASSLLKGQNDFFLKIIESREDPVISKGPLKQAQKALVKLATLLENFDQSKDSLKKLLEVERGYRLNLFKHFVSQPVDIFSDQLQKALNNKGLAGFANENQINPFKLYNIASVLKGSDWLTENSALDGSKTR